MLSGKEIQLVLSVPKRQNWVRKSRLPPNIKNLLTVKISLKAAGVLQSRGSQPGMIVSAWPGMLLLNIPHIREQLPQQKNDLAKMWLVPCLITSVLKVLNCLFWEALHCRPNNADNIAYMTFKKGGIWAEKNILFQKTPEKNTLR